MTLTSGTILCSECFTKQDTVGVPRRTNQSRNKRPFKNSLELISSPISRVLLDKPRPLQTLLLTTFELDSAKSSLSLSS